MSEKSEHDADQLRDEEMVAKLLQVAGSRAEIPPASAARVYERVLDEWQASTTQPDPDRVYDRVLQTWQRRNRWGQRRRWMLPVGVAASAVLAFVLLTEPEPAPRTVVATVSKVITADVASGAPVADESVYAGETLTTGADEGLSLLLSRGESLRIDQNSRIRLDARDRFTLLSGRIYADTGEFVYRDRGLRIETALGAVEDVGTQFAVALDPSQLDVAVREGRVDVQREQDQHIAVAGERLLVVENGGVEMLAVQKNADYWDWVIDLAPLFDIENSSLLEFLKWVSRETGLELEFADNEVRRAAMRTDLHGSIADFTPREALESILATTAFRYRIETDRIVVER